MIENIEKLKEENKKLKVDFDQTEVEYEAKIKKFKFIEERNLMLEQENEKLKNKIDKYIKPPSFNYSLIEK